MPSGIKDSKQKNDSLVRRSIQEILQWEAGVEQSTIKECWHNQ
jgi:hypothetical protein